MIRKLLLGVVGVVACVNVANAQSCGALPFTLTNGTPADATQVMANYTHLLNCVNGAVSTPAGTMLDFAGTTVPTGYLTCDGSAVSRTTYSALFTAIGTTWGAGNGTTTFNLPNFRRRVAVGSGGTGTGTLGNSVGNTGGEETHILTIAEMPAHTHPWGFSGFQSTSTFTPSGGNSNLDFGNVTGNQSGSTGGSGAHNIMQPSAVVLKIIKF